MHCMYSCALHPETTRASFKPTPWSIYQQSTQNLTISTSYAPLSSPSYRPGTIIQYCLELNPILSLTYMCSTFCSGNYSSFPVMDLLVKRIVTLGECWFHHSGFKTNTKGPQQLLRDHLLILPNLLLHGLALIYYSNIKMQLLPLCFYSFPYYSTCSSPTLVPLLHLPSIQY